MPKTLDPFRFLLIAVAGWINRRQQHASFLVLLFIEQSTRRVRIAGILAGANGIVDESARPEYDRSNRRNAPGQAQSDSGSGSTLHCGVPVHADRDRHEIGALAAPVNDSVRRGFRYGPPSENFWLAITASEIATADPPDNVARVSFWKLRRFVRIQGAPRR
jgi:hypothetical protein